MEEDDCLLLPRVDAALVRWFEDKESGKTLTRPAFDGLRRAIFADEIKTAVVWKLDRVSRRLRDGINLLGDWCEQGVRVVVVTQQIDLSGPVGRMVASVLFGLAEIDWSIGGSVRQRGMTSPRLGACIVAE